MKPAVVLALLVTAATACTTMGPMPIATGISPVPANRTSVEIQGGAVPGFELSDGAHAAYAGRGTPLPQLSGLVEPGDAIGVKGLVLGARRVGNEGDTLVEPFAGVRRMVDTNVAVAVLAFGSQSSAGGDNDHVAYAAKRLGGEVAIDTLVVGDHSVALHAQAAVSAMGIWAHGHYCVDATGDGIDCNGDDSDTVVTANVSGLYGAASAGLSLDMFRNPHSVIHLVRLAAMITAGAMPRIVDGVQQDGNAFLSAGTTLTVGFGARD